MSKLSKQEFVELVSKRTSLTKTDTTKTLDAILDVITESLSNGNEVSFTGFGTFGISERKARSGRNPRTGEEIKISAKKAPVFKAGKGLKDEVEGK